MALVESWKGALDQKVLPIALTRRNIAQVNISSCREDKGEDMLTTKAK